MGRETVWRLVKEFRDGSALCVSDDGRLYDVVKVPDNVLEPHRKQEAEIYFEEVIVPQARKRRSK